MTAIPIRIPAVLAAGALVACLAGPAQAAQYQPLAELRGYPSGVILGGGLGFALDDRTYATAQLAYDFAERGSNGRHENEHGGGIGGGFTLDRYFRPAQLGWFVGGRLELFALGIDHRDGARSGHSDTLTLQPTARGGYAWVFDGGRYGLQASLGVGAEINVQTRGEKVGDGAIGLAGVAFTFRP